MKLVLIPMQSQSDEKAGSHETMQSNDSEIVRSNEAHKNDVKHKSLVREDEVSGKENSGTSDVRFEEAEKQSRVGTVCRDAVDSHFESVTDSADGISTDVSARERGRKVRRVPVKTKVESDESSEEEVIPLRRSKRKTKGKHSNPHHEPKSVFSNEVNTQTSIAIEPSALYEQFSKSVMAVQENQTSLAQQTLQILQSGLRDFCNYTK